MGRIYRKVIAINEQTGERREFSGIYQAAKALGTSTPSVSISLAMGTAVKGWKVYDTPEMMRQRIEEIKKQIKIVENEN